WGILGWFLRHGYHVRFPGVAKVDHPERCRSHWKSQCLRIARVGGVVGMVKLIIALEYMNPFRSGITLAAQKPT
ncbi:MAG: hypothetical protein Q7S02_02315, partial [bacterium]|nr:hypothetical protein [bacterium]